MANGLPLGNVLNIQDVWAILANKKTYDLLFIRQFMSCDWSKYEPQTKTLRFSCRRKWELFFQNEKFPLTISSQDGYICPYFACWHRKKVRQQFLKTWLYVKHDSHRITNWQRHISMMFKRWKQYDPTSRDDRTLDPSHKSHNAPYKYPTMHHFVTEMCTQVHISVTKRCIVGYGTGVLWDLCNRSIDHVLQ